MVPIPGNDARWLRSNRETVSGDHGPATLQEYLRVIRQRKLLITAVTVVFAGAALIWSLQQPEIYRAEASLDFRAPEADLDDLGGLPNVFPRESPEMRAASGARVVNRPDIARAVFRESGVDPVRDEVSVAASAEQRTNFVVMQVEARDPRVAATVANLFAEEIVAVRLREFRRDVQRTIDVAEDEFRRLREDERLFRQGPEAERLARLHSLKRLGRPVEIVRPASASSEPVSPHPVRNTLLGLVAGLTFGLLAAFGRNALDRRVRDGGEVAELTELPLIGHIREEALGQVYLDGGAGHPDRAAEFEAFRMLRANLDYLSFDEPVRTALVTSPLAEEGKSTVALSLAIAAVLRGETALLVGCDLRRPVLDQRLGINAEPGLSDYLAGKATPQEVLQNVPLGAVPGAVANGAGPPTLVCITAGTAISEPGALLTSQRFADFLEQISGAYDLVVLDSAPLLAVVDTLEIARLVDAIVVCVRSMQTRRDELVAVRRQLEQLGDKRKGIAFTGLRPDTQSPYGYAYANYHATVRS